MTGNEQDHSTWDDIVLNIDKDCIDSLRNAAQHILDREAQLISDKRSEIIAKMNADIERYEITPDMLIFPNSTTTKASTSIPKYKDPNSDKTWSGRGRIPGWFTKAKKGGTTSEQMEIKDSDDPTVTSQ